jgi:hypothetical protein
MKPLFKTIYQLFFSKEQVVAVIYLLKHSVFTMNTGRNSNSLKTLHSKYPKKIEIEMDRFAICHDV